MDALGSKAEEISMLATEDVGAAAGAPLGGNAGVVETAGGGAETEGVDVAKGTAVAVGTAGGCVGGVATGGGTGAGELPPNGIPEGAGAGAGG